MPVSVRAATKDDLPAIVQLLAQLSLEAPRENLGPPLPIAYARAIDAVLADSRQHLLVAEEDGELSGTVCLIIIPNLSYQARPYAILENMVVDEGHRGKHIGEALIGRCLDLARAAGCFKLSLTSNKSRHGSHRFYEAQGFRATHEGFRYDF